MTTCKRVLFIKIKETAAAICREYMSFSISAGVKRLLVYDYMPFGGGLETHLFDNQGFSRQA